jgi:dihydroflavonol-4-reductase
MANDGTVITGGAGFLGSAVARGGGARLRVRVLVRATSPRATWTGSMPRWSKAICAIPRRWSSAPWRRARPDPRRGRLPAVGAATPEEIVRNNSRAPNAVMAAALAAGRTDRLHEQRGDPARGRRYRAGPPKMRPAGAGRGDRRLQAQQGAGRAPGRRHGGAAERLPAVIVNPSTPIGPRDAEADADRAHHRRSGLRQDAGLRRDRPERGARGRRGAGPSAGAANMDALANAISSAATT